PHDRRDDRPGHRVRERRHREAAARNRREARLRNRRPFTRPLRAAQKEERVGAGLPATGIIFRLMQPGWGEANSGGKHLKIPDSVAARLHLLSRAGALYVVRAFSSIFFACARVSRSISTPPSMRASSSLRPFASSTLMCVRVALSSTDLATERCAWPCAATCA